MADEGLRFEAWSMPHVGALTRKFDFTKLVESWTLNDRFNDLTDGTMSIPDDASLATGVLLKDRLFYIDEANHANDVGSMIRICRGTTPIMHYLITRFEDSFSDGEPTCKFALEGLEWILDRVLVPNYDYPADPSVEPDWIYGAPSILANTDFENAGATNLLIHVWIESTVTAGTWTITFPAQTASGLAWNIDITALQTAIEGLSNIQDIIISGAGTQANPWVIEVVDPAGTDFNVSVNPAGLTGGTVQMLSMLQGGAGIVDPWTHSFNPLTQLEHGTYTNFQTSTVQAHTGTTSLYVKGAIGPWPESFPGAQQVISVTGGRTYRAKVWVYPKFAATYRFVIRSTDETWLGSVEAALTANSWQEMAFSVVIPDHITSIIFRIACISTGNVHEFYMDDALLAPGQDAATLGKMMDDVRTAALAIGSPLTWLTPTWSTTLDSDGVAWDSTRMWNVNHGQSILQLFEYARKWNYEFRLRWDVGDNRFEWDMWNPLAGGQVRANIAITGKSGVTGSAPIVRRPPGATYVRTEGAAVKGGLPWGEFASTTLDDVWGRLEKFHQDRQGVDSTELDELAERIVTKTEENTAARSITVADPTLLPWTAYEPGDTVTLNLAPKDVKKNLRVAAIVASKGPNDAVPQYDVHFGAPVYSNDTAIASGLRTLIREFRRPTPTSLDGTPLPPAVGGGGAPTVVVAAATSTQFSKDRADFQCTGVNDGPIIQQALNVCALKGGTVWLCEGGYFIEIPTTGPAIIIPQTVTLRGLGVGDGASYLEQSNASDPGRQAIVRMRSRTNVQDLTLYTFDSALPIQFETGAAGLRVTDCWIETDNAAGIEGSGNHLVWIERNVFTSGDNPVTEVDSMIHLSGSGLIDIHINRNWINSGWHGVFIDGTQGRNYINHNLFYQNWFSGVRLQSDDAAIFTTSVDYNKVLNPGTGADGSEGDAGIYVSGDPTDIDPTTVQNNGLIVVGNQIEVAGDAVYGIRVSGLAVAQVKDNYIEQAGMHGIFLEDSNWCQIVDNILQEPNTFPTTTFDGIHLVTSDGNTVRGNLVVELRGGSPNYWRYGINVSDAASNDNIVTINDLRLAGSGTGAFNNSGTGTLTTPANYT